MKIFCPKCNHEYEEPVAFCEECGSSLGTPDRPAIPIGGTEDRGGSPGSAVDYAALAGMIGRRNAPEPAAPGPESGLSGLSEGAASVAETDGLLRVETRRNSYFLSGVQMPLELRLTPLSEELKGILVWFSPQVAGSENPVTEIPVEGVVRTGEPLELRIPYRPGDDLAGVVPFRFYFGCLRGDETEFFQTTVLYRVRRNDQRKSSVVNRITINASEAGSVNAGFQDLLKAAREESADELLDRLSSAPREFETRPLETTAWRPESLRAEGRCHVCDRLTLEADGRLFQVLAARDIRLGRQADRNDIVVADPTQSASPHEYPNNTISRTHAQIQYCGDTVNLFDSSTYGTFIDGVRPVGGGVPIPRSAALEFGDIRWLLEMQRCEQRGDDFCCRMCPARRIRSIVLTRTDRVPETYLLVWECCDLGAVSPGLAGMTLIRRNGGFILRTPEGRCRYLSPGCPVAAGDVVMAVKDFQQYGM